MIDPGSAPYDWPTILMSFIIGDSSKYPFKNSKLQPKYSTLQYYCENADGEFFAENLFQYVKPLFNQYSKTHKITIHQGNNSR